MEASSAPPPPPLRLTKTKWRALSLRLSGDHVGINLPVIPSRRLKAFSMVSRSTFDLLETGLRICILNGYHALAIDEHRGDFRADALGRPPPE